MDAEILTVGTELLLGFTLDTNAAELGSLLAEAGIRVVRRATVADEAGAIADAAAAALARTGTVIVCGGLGPTTDDITREAVASLFARPLVRDQAIAADLTQRFARQHRAPMPASNLRQADVPEGAAVLPNRWGTAPGLWLEDEAGRLAVLLPGVPSEMRALLESEVLPRLLERMSRGEGSAGPDSPSQGRRAPYRHGTGRAVIRSRVLRTTGITESALADRLGDVERRLGVVTLASLPGADGVDLRLTAWQVEPKEADTALEQAAAAVRPLLGAHHYGEGDSDLAAVVLALLEHEGGRLAVAESCTGGLLAQRLTAVPGASAVFVGGVIAYANDVKLRLLGVPAELLAEHGAVSEPVASRMALGVAGTMGADAALAITGIAGPDGGTPDKPVGTVCLAVSWRGSLMALTRFFPGEREAVRGRATAAALDALRRMLGGSG